MATIKDVAKLADVSLGTVSNVFNNLPSVSEEVRSRVLEAATALNYRPNQIARSMRRNRTHSIGLVVPDISNPFYYELAKGVGDKAMEDGIMLFLCDTNRDTSRERRIMNVLPGYMVDGLIWWKPLVPQNEILSVFSDIPIVFSENDEMSKENEFNSVYVDIYEGAVKAMQYLIGCGHKNIAFISGSGTAKSTLDRERAYKDVMEACGFDIRPEYIAHGNFKWQGGYDAAYYLLTLPEAPSAIFAANDLSALGCMKAAKDLGLSVPDDISIIGFDDTDMAVMSIPQLTTVRQPCREIGEACYRMLKTLSYGNPEARKVRSQRLGTELIIRESVRKII